MRHGQFCLSVLHNNISGVFFPRHSTKLSLYVETKRQDFQVDLLSLGGGGGKEEGIMP